MIIGITGTLGAGKGTVVDFLTKELNFRHYSVRKFLAKEVERRGLPLNRDTLTDVANDLRAQHGPGYVSQQILDVALADGADAAIESIRTIGEALYLKSHGAKIWAVDADIHKRYERVAQRASETDKVSFEKFVEDEKREFSNIDPTKQNISGVIAMADVTLTNNGTRDELYEQIKRALLK
ncbi:MAG TPA: AAA family ATPase [Candidatus Paceibacterota bacterium]|nr:AAA family ATPase [Candidatus Paceibacterota bacterium]